jgi:hypothetical protein
MLKRVRAICVGGLIVGLLILAGSYQACHQAGVGGVAEVNTWWATLGALGFVAGVAVLVIGIIFLIYTFLDPTDE